MSEKLKQDISIGQNLKALRVKSKLTQERVAAKLQTMGLPVSREIVSQMEAGKYSLRVSVLLALKELYRASFDDFFQGLT
ncbi:MAG: helix-turn-helix domain-containing protein [Clostridiales bacterium]|nr:helix-turn-helix domain-containing protein [Clostridiales bacterium]